MKHTRRMGEDRISSLLFRFSIPAITGMTVTALYNIVDRIFIGRGVGSLALSGVTIGFPIMLVMMAFGMLVGLGATALISIRLGENRRGTAELILANAVTLFFIFSLILGILGSIFLKELMVLFGASSVVLPYAIDYMRIILGGVFFMSISFGMNHFIRAEGNPKIAMITMLLGAVINVILDAVFIFGLGLGVKGAALATVIAQFSSSVWVFAYFLGKRSTLRFRFRYLLPHLKTVKSILTLGSSFFMMQLAASVIWLFLNRSLAVYGGDHAIAAMGIIHSLAMFILMPCFGINQGVQPIIGFNYGARKFKRVKRAWLRGIGLATIICVAGYLVIMIFPTQLVSIFSKENQELVETGARGLRIFLLLLPVVGFQIVATSYFQATGKPGIAMFLTLSRQVILFLPFLMIFPHFFGLTGVWIVSPLSDIGAFLLTGTFFLREIKKLNEKISEEVTV
jgi:putative MATE family efflux protein